MYLHLRVDLDLSISLPDVTLDPLAVPLGHHHARLCLHLGRALPRGSHLHASGIDDEESPLKLTDLRGDGSRDGIKCPKAERELPESLICDGHRAKDVEGGAESVMLGGPEGREALVCRRKGREGDKEVQLLVRLEAELTQVEGACGKSCSFLTHREFVLS